jgi:hypothetical protein
VDTPATSTLAVVLALLSRQLDTVLAPFHAKYLRTKKAVRLDMPLLPDTFTFNPAWTVEERQAAVDAAQEQDAALSHIRIIATKLDPKAAKLKVEPLVNFVFAQLPGLDAYRPDITFIDYAENSRNVKVVDPSTGVVTTEKVAMKATTATYFGTPNNLSERAQATNARIAAMYDEIIAKAQAAPKA